MPGKWMFVASDRSKAVPPRRTKEIPKSKSDIIRDLLFEGQPLEEIHTNTGVPKTRIRDVIKRFPQKPDMTRPLPKINSSRASITDRDERALIRHLRQDPKVRYDTLAAELSVSVGARVPKHTVNSIVRKHGMVKPRYPNKKKEDEKDMLRAGKAGFLHLTEREQKLPI